MRKLLVIGVAAMVTAGLTLAAAPAGAGVGAKSSKKFCKAVTSAFKEIQAGPTGLDPDSAGSVATALRKAAKSAPSKKVKSATKTLATFYDAIADGDDPSDGLGEDAARYGKAVSVFTTAYISSCIGEVSIPDVSIPEIN